MRIHLLIIYLLFVATPVIAQSFYAIAPVYSPPGNNAYLINLANCDSTKIFTCPATNNTNQFFEIIYSDVAIDKDQNIYYTSAWGSLYKQNQSNANSCQFLGSFDNGNATINALVSDSNNTLYAAGNNGGICYLYKYESGKFTTLGNLPANFFSAGDLFFYEHRLFLTATDAVFTSSYLVEINIAEPQKSCYYMGLENFQPFGAFSTRNGSKSEAYIICTDDMTISNTTTSLRKLDIRNKTFSNKLCTYPFPISGAANYYSLTSGNAVCCPVISTIVNANICEGEAYYGYTSPGIYVDTFFSLKGCDSIRTLNLSLVKPIFTTTSAIICEGQNYNGHSLAGFYIDTLQSVNGCDSICSVNLIVNSKKITTIDTAFCKGNSFHGYSSSGSYVDSLRTYLGCDSIVNIHLTVYDLPIPNLGADRNVCINEPLTLMPGVFKDYLWQDGSTANSFIVYDTGIYYVKVTDLHNCVATDTIRITKKDTIPANFLPQDSSLCFGSIVSITVKNYKSYLWSTGSTNATLPIISTGFYTLTVKDFNDCTGTDTIVIVQRNDCIPFIIPSAFTPNGDGKNDRFYPILNQAVSKFRMEIFNRYGQKIFETTDPATGWDGRYKNIKQPPGAYVYKISYKNQLGFINQHKGSVILIQ